MTMDYDEYQQMREREHWAQLDAEEAEREEQQWFEENEAPLIHEPEPCPHCGGYGLDYEPDTQRPCGCPDTEHVVCANCGEHLGIAQYDACDCEDWTCEGDDALYAEEWEEE